MLRKRDLKTAELARLEYEIGQRKVNPEAAWALWVFLSYLGAHRFYLGDHGVGSAMLLTTTVPSLCIIVQLGSAANGSSTVFESSLVFWISVLLLSLVWSWVDGLRISPRLRRANAELEQRILQEIDSERNSPR